MPLPPCSESLPSSASSGAEQRVAGFAAQIDDPHRRHRRAEPRAQLEPLESLPALRPRRRAAVDGDGAFERGPLGRDSPGVVARIGLLLVRGVMLLVDADQTQVRHRREDRRAGADDDRRLTRDDPLALVATLGVGQPRVQDRDPIAEARLKAAERLRCQGDLGHEDDRAASARERRRAGLEVDLGLAAARRPCEQQVRSVPLQRLDDPCDRSLLRLRQLVRLGLAGHPRAGRSTLAAPRPEPGSDELERSRGRRAVVVGEPQRQIDERRRQLVEQRLDRRRLDARRRLHPGLDHHPARGRAAEPDRDDGALADIVRHLVGERTGDRARGDERIDLGERHPATVTADPARRPRATSRERAVQ